MLPPRGPRGGALLDPAAATAERIDGREGTRGATVRVRRFAFRLAVRGQGTHRDGDEPRRGRVQLDRAGRRPGVLIFLAAPDAWSRSHDDLDDGLARPPPTATGQGAALFLNRLDGDLTARGGPSRSR